jgi:hypothetical protein
LLKVTHAGEGFEPAVTVPELAETR